MIEARLIWFLRLGQLAATLLLAFIVLGLSGNILNKVPAGFNAPDYAGLALATSVLTLITIAPTIIIDFFRKGAFTSFVISEIAWASILTVLWLAAAADTTSILKGTSCSSTIVSDGFIFSVPSDEVATCHEAQAVAAFSWLIFFNLGSWLVFLIVAASIAHTRGNGRVWVGPVTGTEFFAPAGKAEQSVNAVQYAPAQQVPQGYVGQQQQGYPSPQMQQQYTGGSIPQQAPASYPPSGGYSPAAPQVQA